VEESEEHPSRGVMLESVVGRGGEAACDIDRCIRVESQSSGLFCTRRAVHYKDVSVAECYRIFDEDYRLDDRVVKDTYAARDLRDCERACSDARFFNCKAFGYTNSGRMERNCAMSDLDAIELRSGNNVVMDYDYAVYERLGGCGGNGGGGGFGGVGGGATFGRPFNAGRTRTSI
jgi:hypothetical protein